MLLPEPQRLLKANAVRELGSRVSYDFTDLQQQGDAYLAEVRKQAQAIVQSAQQEAQGIRQAAQREAQEQGRREGLKESGRIIEEQSNRLVEQRMGERVATTLPALAAIAESLRQERDEWLTRWEQAAVHVSVAIAEKILHHRLNAQPERAAHMITEALRLAAGNPMLRIHLHSKDLALFGSQAEEIVKTAAACAEATLIADDTITRGGCRIETRHGEIDTRLETMLARITDELMT